MIRADAGKGLRWLTAAVTALVLAPLALELLRWHPGYAFGDEGIEVSLLQGLRLGRPLAFRLTQGSLTRLLQFAWISLAGTRLAWLHVPQLAVFAAELAALYLLARRWAGGAAACWAVLADLVASTTWLRVHSLLSFQQLPLELLLLGLAAGWVRGRGGALLWGAVAGLLALDYEGVLVGVPFLFLACAREEPGFRRQAGWAAAAGLATLAFLALCQREQSLVYVGTRTGIFVGHDGPRLLAALEKNLRELFTGGHPMAYFGVENWPVIPFWVWPGLGLGLLAAWGTPALGWVLWAVAATLITQCSLAPFGLPANRLVTAWPALCLLAGLGFARLWAGRGRLGRVLALGLLALGLALELHAYVVHQLSNADSVFGRSESLEDAAADASRLARQRGAAVLTRLADWRFPVVGFHLAGRDLPQAAPGAPALVFFAPEYRMALRGLGLPVRVYQRGKSQEPVLVALAEGPAAERFKAVERDLAEARGDQLDEEAARRRRLEGWLRAHPDADDFAWSSLCHSDAQLAWFLDEGIGEEQYRLATRRPLNSPGPYAKLGEYYLSRDAGLALALARRALAVDPQYLPALDVAKDALLRLGCPEQAAEVQALKGRLYSRGAWYIAR